MRRIVGCRFSRRGSMLGEQSLLITFLWGRAWERGVAYLERIL